LEAATLTPSKAAGLPRTWCRLFEGEAQALISEGFLTAIGPSWKRRSPMPAQIRPRRESHTDDCAPLLFEGARQRLQIAAFHIETAAHSLFSIRRCL
jgi:hypothetical protein